MAASKPARITLYSGPGCPHCHRLRQFLRQQKIPFQEFDISRNRRARQEFDRLGSRGVPLLKIGQRLLAGFDPGKLRSALRQTGHRV